MLKLSLAITLATAVSGMIMESPPLDSVPQDKKDRISSYFSLVQKVSNGVQNNRTTPGTPKNPNPTIPIPT